MAIQVYQCDECHKNVDKETSYVTNDVILCMKCTRKRFKFTIIEGATGQIATPELQSRNTYRGW